MAAGLVRRGKHILIVLVICTLALILFKSWTVPTTEKQVILDESQVPRQLAPESVNAGTDMSPGKADSVSKSHSGIPKILHQTFSTELVYENYRPLINSCLVQNPDWTYYLWRDSDAKAFISSEYPQYLKGYAAYWDNLQRSDAIRYIVLHRFGGIYLDMDVECVRPFHPALTNETAFIDQERVEQTQVLWGTEFSAMNSAMGSVPGHPFYRLMADRVLTKKVNGNAFETTGPTVLTRVYKEYKGTEEAKVWPVRLLPPSVISPLMDTQKDWRVWCKGALNAKGPRLGWKERGCQMLQSKQWRMDDTDNGTLAVHRFLHLGYGFSAGLRKGKFNVTDAFRPMVNFYSNSEKSHT